MGSEAPGEISDSYEVEMKLVARLVGQMVSPYSLTVLFTLFYFTSENVNAEVIDVHYAVAPPWNNPDKPEGGFQPALVKEVFKRSGLKTKTHFTPFRRILKDLVDPSQSVAGVVGTGMNGEKALETEISVIENYFLYVRKDHPTNFRNFTDLKGKSFSSWYGPWEEHVKKKYEMNSVLVESVPQGIKMVDDKRVSVVLFEAETLYYEAVKHAGSPAKAKEKYAIEFPVFKIGVSMAMSNTPKMKKIHKKFEKGMEEVVRDGTFDRLVKKFLHVYPAKNYDLLSKRWRKFRRKG